MGRFDGRGHGGAINKRKVSIALTFEHAGAPPSRHVERTVDARGRAPCCIFALTQAQALRRFLGSGPILDTLPPRSKTIDRSNGDRQTTRAVGDLQTNSHGRAGARRRLAARITPATGSPRPSSRNLDDRAMRSRSSSSMSSRSSMARRRTPGPRPGESLRGPARDAPNPSSAGAVSRWEGLAKRLAKRSRVAPWTPALLRSSLSSSQSSSS
jgi:hypothetical protein